MNSNKDSKKSKFSLFSSLFGGKKNLSIYEEAQVQSPFRTVLRTFRSNKVAMTAFIVWLLIFSTVMIYPLINPVDLAYSDITQANKPPGRDLMKFNPALVGRVADMEIGPTFTFGVSTEGTVYAWGKTKIGQSPQDFKNDIPKDMGRVVKVAAGIDHAVALNDKGEVFGWGFNRFGQLGVPDEPADGRRPNALLLLSDVPPINMVKNIVDIYAGAQYTVALTKEGYTYFYGNKNLVDYNDYHPYQGQIEKLALTSSNIIGLTFDNELVYLGHETRSPFARFPEISNPIDIAATADSVAAIFENGEIRVWGNASNYRREGHITPADEIIGNPIMIRSGRHHYVILTDENYMYSWGIDKYGVTNIPQRIQNANVVEIYSGYFQNYAITDKGQILTWGLEGYVLGSDDLGRDILDRTLNGGRLSMTIGAVAVIISLIIAITLGSLSGFFGGRIDIILQRISEIVAAIPFLPLAMILSSVIGARLPTQQRILMLMVILGLLGWTGLYRLVRAQVFSIREQEYVVAARSIGIKPISIVFRHILPNIISVIIVSATISFGTSLLTESSLSYLGFGVLPPYPTWGNMLTGANNSIVIQNFWWRWAFTSIILSSCVICINLIGEGLRVAIDPKSQER